MGKIRRCRFLSRCIDPANVSRWVPRLKYRTTKRKGMLPTLTPDGPQYINKNVRSILIGKIRTSQIAHLHSTTSFLRIQFEKLKMNH